MLSWQQRPNTRPVWTEQRLKRLLDTFYGDTRVIVLANREPFRHEHGSNGELEATRSGGGLVTALEPLLRACSGVWVAHGAGTADRAVVDARDGLQVSGPGGYRLRRVWLTAEEERGYYYGFANEGLWPFCHRAHVQPIFRPADFRMYQAINARFAEAVVAEAGCDAPLVFVQDYHFALAPRLVRERLPHSTIATFWHIPWPQSRDCSICPWTRELVEGLLASTVVGFQTPDDCGCFIDTAAATLDVTVDRAQQAITYRGRRTLVRPYPISIEWPHQCSCRSTSVERSRQSVRRRLQLQPDTRLGVGIDRLDYTKGLIEKCLAVEQLLVTRPELQGQFVFVQVAEPSRVSLPAYRAYRSRLLECRDRINRRFGRGSYRPLILLEAHHEAAEVCELMRAADLCFVGSLHDGMNLVAKEFASARDDERGVLILSQFTGAARELNAALIVNPYAVDDCARALHAALTMTAEEQSVRMRAMRSVIAEFNVYRWAGQIVLDSSRLRSRGNAPRVRAETPRIPPMSLEWRLLQEVRNARLPADP